MGILDIVNFSKEKEENKEENKEKQEENDNNKENSKEKNDNTEKIEYPFGEEFNKVYGDSK
jgi:hypothetical protein